MVRNLNFSNDYDWNLEYQGLNDPLKQKEVCSFVKVNRLSLFGVVETKIRSVNLPHSTGRCFPGHWQYVHNLDVLPVARIIVGWDPQQLAVTVVFSSPQMLMVSVDLCTHQKRFYASVIYGLNLASERSAYGET